MDQSKQHFQLSEEKLMFLQSIPTLVGLCWVIYSPFAAHKSLKIWRSLQVYDSQGLVEEDLVVGGGKQKKTTVKEFSIHTFLLISLMIMLIDCIPSWPWYASIRQSMPFIYIGIISFFSFKNFFNFFFSRGIESVSRKRKESKEGAFKFKYVPLLSKVEQESGTNVFISLCISIAIAYYCATSAHPIIILVIITPIISSLLTPLFHVPFPVQDKISLRSYTKDGVRAIGTIGICIGILMAFIYKVLPLFSNGDKDDTKWEITYDQDDIIFSQFRLIILIALWSVSMLPSVTLVCLAYRYDAYQSGYTKLTREEINSAIAESKEFAKSNNSLENVDQIPILVNSSALRVPFLIEEDQRVDNNRLPTFSVALKTLTTFHIGGLLLIWIFISNWFNIPYFVKSTEEVSVFLFTFPINLVSLLSFFVLPPFMLINIALRERRSGVDFRTSMKKLWNHEESWLANGDQASFDRVL